MILPFLCSKYYGIAFELNDDTVYALCSEAALFEEE